MVSTLVFTGRGVYRWPSAGQTVALVATVLQPLEIVTPLQRGFRWRRAVDPAVPPALRRTALRLVLIVATAAVVTACVPTMSAEERYLLDATNSVRASVGRSALVHDERLAQRARWWAGVMASDGMLRHSDLNGIPLAWTKAGENVGRGGSVESIHRALVASSGHYATVIDPDFNKVGMGTVRAADGTLFAVEIFCRC